MGFSWDSLIETGINAVIQTAGAFVLGGGPAGQAPASPQTPLQSKIAGPVGGTGRVPRPSTPDAPGVADVDQFYAEWFGRMRRFSNITSTSSVGTQSRRG